MKEGKPAFDPYEGDSPYIFVSYCHEDSQRVVPDIEQLARLKFRIWYDQGILAGMEWKKSLRTHIERCRLFLLFASKAAVESENVDIELELAKKVRKLRKQNNETPLIIFSVILDDDIDPLDPNFTYLEKLEFINKCKFSGPGMAAQYYSVLVDNLEKAAKATRADAIERDAMVLGIGSVPSLCEVLCEEETALTLKEIEDRRDAFVLEMRNKTDSTASYRIENVFQLTSKASNALANLGDVDLLETDSQRPSNLLSRQVDISEVYVAPLRLVTGLITRLDDHWPPLVDSYRVLVEQDKVNRLDDLHYFIEFCWMAWGPSVLTTSLLAEKGEFMVAQAAFGDEANSLPLIVKKDHWRRLRQTPGLPDNGQAVRLLNALVVRPGIDPFFQSIREHELFRDVFDDPPQVALYLPFEDARYKDGVVEAITGARDAFYSTAYVWLMLEQVGAEEHLSSGGARGRMTPGRVIPFFEHANLATSKGLDFLQHCLARKAIFHVLECEVDKDYSDTGYYRFATALFPEKMVKILETEIKRMKENEQATIRRRLIIPHDPREWRTPLEVVHFADDIHRAIKDCCRELVKKTGVALGGRSVESCSWHD